jgi:tetratricopeptide (TPR) repeat protein
MANTSETSELVSQAWNRQRQGNPDAAITEFQRIVQQHPKDIDANYGLALAQKAVGQTEAAIKTFKNTLELIEDSRNIYESTRERTGEQDNIKTPEDDRYMMLSRMVRQRLAELEKLAKS